jgi:hypothetical protein
VAETLATEAAMTEADVPVEGVAGTARSSAREAPESSSGDDAVAGSAGDDAVAGSAGDEELLVREGDVAGD